MKILAFAASNSRHSINRALVEFAAKRLQAEHLPEAELSFLDINDYEMPIYSPEREEADGVPALAQQFRDQMAAADGLLISYAEHNGHYPAAYKNLFDWASRHGAKVYGDSPAVYLATSPGARGGASVLNAALTSAPFFGAEIKGSLSVPSFGENFDAEAGGLTNPDLLAALDEALAALAASLRS